MKITTILLAALAAVCAGEYIELDVQVTHLLGDNQTETEEREILIDESYVTPEPPTIVLDENGEEVSIERQSMELSMEDFQKAYGKEPRRIDQHMNFGLGFGVGLVPSKDWSPWTCCRYGLRIQSRERVVEVPRIEMEYKNCDSNFCQEHECQDSAKSLCDRLGVNSCHSKVISTFMSHNCPQTCNFCSGAPQQKPQTTKPSWPFYTRPTTRQPWRPFTTTTKTPYYSTRPVQPWRPQTTRAPRTQETTRAPWRPNPTKRPTRPWTKKPAPQLPSEPQTQNIVEVKVFSHSRGSDLTCYKFSIDQTSRQSWPWKEVAPNSGDLSSFHLYRSPTDVYNRPIYFCRARDSSSKSTYKWAVKKSVCRGGWVTQFVLYASFYKTSKSQLLIAANSGSPHWTTRISKTFPANGYTSSVFFFYGPKVTSSQSKPSYPYRPQPTRPQFPITRPTRPQYPVTRPTRPPFPGTRPTRPPFPPKPTTTFRPPSGGVGGPQPTNDFNRECLDAHNFFRAVHNVPLLRWSPELAKTAQLWASQLKAIAPNHPERLVLPGQRTRNWPHSDSGGGYRNRGDGENIAWDLSGDGSPAKESVLRWYSEIYYYNRENPTYSQPGKPVGHLTQMLWKDTTEVGCGVAISQVGSFSKSTWTVSHYSPGGNVRYFGSAFKTKQLYDKQVPDMRPGSCILKSAPCGEGNQCMAFGPGASCQCSQQTRRPSCASRHGCAVNCKNTMRRFNWTEECQGSRDCKCTNDKGAVCT